MKMATFRPRHLWSIISHIYLSVNIGHQALKPKAGFGEGEREEFCVKGSAPERLVVLNCIYLISFY